MHPEVAALEILSLLFKILPGFFAAWIFYGLTAHPKADWFERCVQALIFTVLIQAATNILRWILLGLGELGLSVGPWNEGSNLVWSVILGLLMGLAFARAAN